MQIRACWKLLRWKNDVEKELPQMLENFGKKSEERWAYVMVQLVWVAFILFGKFYSLRKKGIEFLANRKSESVKIVHYHEEGLFMISG